MAEYKDIIQMYKNIRTYAEERDQREILNCLKNYPFDILSFDPFDPLKYKNIGSMSRSRSFGECMLMNLVLDICGNITELMSSADILNMISSFHSFYSFNHLMNYLMVAVNPFYKRTFESVLDNDSNSVELIRGFARVANIHSDESMKYLLYAADHSGNVDAIKEISRMCMESDCEKSDSGTDIVYQNCRFTVLELLLKYGLTNEFDELYNKFTVSLGDMFQSVPADCELISLYKVAERYRDEGFIDHLLLELNKLSDDLIWGKDKSFDEKRQKKKAEIIDFLPNISFTTSDAVLIFQAYMTEKKQHNDRNAEMIMKLMSDDAVFMLQREAFRDPGFYKDAGKWIKENNIPICIDNELENIDPVLDFMTGPFSDSDTSIYNISYIKNIIKDNKLICNGNIKENSYINGLFKFDARALPIILGALDINTEMRDDLIDMCIEYKNFNALNQVRHLKPKDLTQA